MTNSEDNVAEGLHNSVHQAVRRAVNQEVSQHMKQALGWPLIVIPDELSYPVYGAVFDAVAENIQDEIKILMENK